ncbi:MAG: hypothetical protein K0S33_1700 [Bacteroidetes bacterium]|jgi:hypothetical protein|nr:hypothetical protein [Bacteroidota bacterium]
MKDFFRPLFLEGNWLSFYISIITIAFLLGTLETLSRNDLGGVLLSCLLCYALLSIAIVFHYKKIGGVSIGIAILLLLLVSIIGIVLIILIEANVYILSYDHPLKHNFFLDWSLPNLGIGLINGLAIFICSKFKRK